MLTVLCPAAQAASTRPYATTAKVELAKRYMNDELEVRLEEFFMANIKSAVPYLLGKPKKTTRI
jgi:hypothetical protein